MQLMQLQLPFAMPIRFAFDDQCSKIDRTWLDRNEQMGR